VRSEPAGDRDPYLIMEIFAGEGAAVDPASVTALTRPEGG